MNDIHDKAAIKSGYYLSNKSAYATINKAWEQLVNYVNTIKSQNPDDQQIIFNETNHTVTIKTKNKQLALDRYVPIKDPVILDPLSANIKQ